MTEDTCTCEDFKKALGEESGSEGYGSAIDLMNDGYHYIGIINTPIKFCPWCGKKVKCPLPS